MTTPRLRSVVVVGAGLLGTSIGLALRLHGIDVHLVDADEGTAARAADQGAGTVGVDSLALPADLAVVAVTPAATAAVVADLLGRAVARTVTDVASVKERPRAELAALAADTARYVGGHPMAGGERSGPAAARADLFLGRPWVLTPGSATAPDAVEVVRLMARLCGAVPTQMSPVEHDRTVALVSHAPHILAALVAGQLVDADPAARALCGQGIRDVTRIAASDPGLWRGILERNADPVAAVLRAVRADLDVVIAALEQELDLPDGSRGSADRPPEGADRRTVGADRSAGGVAGAAVAAVLARGVEGRRLMPGKHGAAATAYTTVSVVITDRPGQLAGLFAAAGEVGINIEDVRIDHAPGQPLGLIELAVRPSSAARLVTDLRTRGWTVHD